MSDFVFKLRLYYSSQPLSYTYEIVPLLLLKIFSFSSIATINKMCKVYLYSKSSKITAIIESSINLHPHHLQLVPHFYLSVPSIYESCIY